jgi:HD-like signal output (HDOD) protein
MAVRIDDTRLLAAASKLPATPRIFQQLSLAIKDPDVSIESIVSVVRLDPALSAKVLRASNSPFFSRGGRCNSLDEAIERVGIYVVYQLVGATVASQLFSAGLPVYGVTGDELWQNSVATAVALDFLSEAAGADGRVGYTVGLLRPVGRLVLQRLAAEMNLGPRAGLHETAALVDAWEQTTFGLTNTEAVERVFQIWEYPAQLTQPIRHHFNPTSDPKRGPLTALLHLAGWVATEYGKGLRFEQGAWSLDPAILSQAGLETDAVEQCFERTKRIAGRIHGLFRGP